MEKKVIVTEKREVTKYYCDDCGIELDTHYSCNGCGKIYCEKCGKKHLIRLDECCKICKDCIQYKYLWDEYLKLQNSAFKKQREFWDRCKNKRGVA